MPQIGELILLAAPSCSGKSRFLDQLLGGQLEQLSAEIGITAPTSQYSLFLPDEIAISGSTTIDKMILHYAFPIEELVERKLHSLADDPRLDSIASARRVVVITLLVGLDILVSRIRIRRRAAARRLVRGVGHFLEARRRLTKLGIYCADPRNMTLAYDMWFHYVNSLPNLHRQYLITCDDDYKLVEKSAWTGFPVPPLPPGLNS